MVWCPRVRTPHPRSSLHPISLLSPPQCWVSKHIFSFVKRKTIDFKLLLLHLSQRDFTIEKIQKKNRGRGKERTDAFEKGFFAASDTDPNRHHHQCDTFTLNRADDPSGEKNKTKNNRLRSHLGCFEMRMKTSSQTAAWILPAWQQRTYGRPANRATTMPSESNKLLFNATLSAFSFFFSPFTKLHYCWFSRGLSHSFWHLKHYASYRVGPSRCLAAPAQSKSRVAARLHWPELPC